MSFSQISHGFKVKCFFVKWVFLKKSKDVDEYFAGRAPIYAWVENSVTWGSKVVWSKAFPVFLFRFGILWVEVQTSETLYIFTPLQAASNWHLGTCTEEQLTMLPGWTRRRCGSAQRFMPNFFESEFCFVLYLFLFFLFLKPFVAYQSSLGDARPAARRYYNQAGMHNLCWTWIDFFTFEEFLSRTRLVVEGKAILNGRLAHQIKPGEQIWMVEETCVIFSLVKTAPFSFVLLRLVLLSSQVWVCSSRVCSFWVCCCSDFLFVFVQDSLGGSGRWQRLCGLWVGQIARDPNELFLETSIWGWAV